MARSPSKPSVSASPNPGPPDPDAIGPHLLFILQGVGGVGKSTLARGLAELVPEAAVYEIESTARLVELGDRVQHFPIRADAAQLVSTGGEAALTEFNPAINALLRETRPAIVDIGANGASSFMAAIGRSSATFARRRRPLGILLAAAAPEAAYDSVEMLAALAQPWAARQFVVANLYRDTVDLARVQRLAPEATVNVLRRFSFAAGVRSVVEPLGLALIPRLDEEALADRLRDGAGQPDFALAATTVHVLAEFRLEVMRAVRGPAEWLIG